MHVAAVGELIAVVERAVLDDERNFEFSGRQSERALFLVLDDDGAGQAAVDLRRRLLMRVRMIEIHPGAIADLEFVDVSFAWIDRRRRMAVHQHRRMQAVPMRDGLLWQFVAKPNANLLSLFETQEGTEVSVRQRR